MTSDFSVTPDLSARLSGLRGRFLVIGVIGIAASAAGFFVDPNQFFRAYLAAFLFWIGVSLGCTALNMLHNLTGGAWGVVIKRVLEAGSRSLPVAILAFIPLIFGIHNLYEWSHAEAVAKSELLQHKSAYLNVPFFLGRAAFYFVVWLLIAHLLNKWSAQQDTERNPWPLMAKMKALSGPGLLVYGGTVTFAVIDWAMSLQPEWFSTIYGMIYMGAQAVSTLCLVIATVVALSSVPPLRGAINKTHLHDLGKLLFAFTLLWTYFNLSQFLIIWSGNLPEEIPYFLTRMKDGWQYVSLALIALHFVLPFALLLSRDVKQNGKTLRRVAMLLVVARFLDLYWQIAPTGHAPGLPWMYLVTPLAIGGLWLAYFVTNLSKRPLLPVGDPRLEEALAHGGHH